MVFLCVNMPGFAQNDSHKPAIAAPAAAPPAPAITPIRPKSSLQGMIVRDVVFRGIQEDNRVLNNLRDLVTQESGKPFDRYKIRQSLQALYATGRFADLKVEAQQTSPQDLTLVFVATPNVFIGTINAEGAPKRPTNGQLVDATKLQLGELVTPVKIEAAVERVKAVLRENGFYQATVSVQQTYRLENQLADLVFKIMPNNPVHIGKFTVQGDSGYSESEIAKMIDMEPGHTVTQERVTKALQKLRKKFTKQGRLESQISIIERNYHEDTNLLDYVIKINRGPTVDVKVEGASISKGKLRRYVPIYEENAVDNDLLNEGRRNLRDYLQTKGYFDAKVNFSQHYLADKDHLNVIYDIDRGEKHELIAVNFDITPGQYIPTIQKEPPFFSEEQRRQVLQVQKKSMILSNGRYSQALMAQDIESLTALYRGSGFLQAKVEGAIQDDYQGKAGEIVVTYRINEGPQTKVGKVTIQGNSTFDKDQLPGLNTADGQPYSESNINLDRDALLNFYFDKGFPNSQFEARVAPTPGDASSMDVTFVINEGKQFFIDRVLTSKLEFTRPSVVQKQFEVHSGDALSQSEMAKTQSNLYNLGVFNEVKMAIQNPDGDAKYKDILMQFQEGRRWTFNYGVGVEASTGQPDQQSCQQLAEQGETSVACSQGRTGVSPRATFDISRINFRGLAHTLSFRSTIGRLQQRGLVSYIAPRWLGKPNWTLTWTAFYDNSINVTTFTSERLEGAVQAEQQYSRISRLLYRFTYRRVKASNVVVAPDQVPLFSRPVRVGMPSISYIRDKRDDVLETFNGNFSTVDAGVSSRYFGSEASFGRFIFQNATYHPFGRAKIGKKRWVFARNLRFGVEEPVNNDFIPLPERFFAGGSNSHRGFALNQAGPRDLITGSPLGGYAVWVNSLELRTPPLVLPYIQDNLSLVFFHDSGNVFTDTREMFKSLFRWYQPRQDDCKNQAMASQCSFAYVSQAVGAGIRYRTPIGPVRMDLGYNLNPTVYPATVADANGNAVFQPLTTRRLNFVFSIGQTF
jgi:outer membrane protein insertion porin family